MAVSRDDFGAAFRALADGARTSKDLRNAFRDQQSRLDRGERKSLAELLGVAPAAPTDIRTNPAALDTLGEILIELEFLTEPELEKMVGTLLARPDRKTLPALPIPPSLSKFDIQWEVGRSASGCVYRARRAEEPRDISIKLYRDDARPDPDRLRRQVGLREPGLVPVFEAGDGYAVMEYVEGASVDTMVAARKLSLRRGFEVMEKCSRILAPLHARGLAHGSLKPGALLVKEDDSVRIADFGLAGGTPADDIFAMGAILYEIATGTPPFAGFHAQQLRPPSRHNPAVAGDGEKIILKALERDPGRRYAHAGEMAEDLARHLRHEPVLAQVSAPEPSAPATRLRSPALYVAGGVAAVVVLAVAAFALSGSGRTKPAGPQDQPREAVSPPAPDRPAPPVVADGETKPKPPAPPAPDPRREAIVRKGPIREREQIDLRYAASLALARGDFERLVELGEEFVLRGADTDYAWHWLALGHRGLRQTEKAVEAIDAAIARAPHNVDYINIRMPLLLERAENQRALKDIETLYGRDTNAVNRAMQLITKDLNGPDPTASLWIHRGALLHYKRNYRQAIEDFRKAVQLGDSRAYYFIALSFKGDDRRDEALDALRQFLAGHPGGPAEAEARALLGKLEHP